MQSPSNEEDVRELDAREIDGEPFTDIMAALRELSDDGTLKLINSFEPVPLYQILEERGFDYQTNRVGDDEWHIAISQR